MQNIIFHIILTNQCNKRCEYCDLDFSNNTISYENIDIFIDYINKKHRNFWEIRINFFGWEPMLEFEKIQYIIEKISVKNIFYSIGTNGVLFWVDKYLFLKNNHVEIQYSIDSQTYYTLLEQKYIDVEDENFSVNFILNPNDIEKSFEIFDLIAQRWVKKIYILPVYATILWTKYSLVLLHKFIEHINDFHQIEKKGLSYYDEPTSDREYIIETNWSVYQDIHTHLWFLKQYDNIDHTIKQEIADNSYICKIDTIDENIWEIMFCKLQKLYKMSLEIAKNQGFQKSFTLIDKILHNIKN